MGEAALQSAPIVLGRYALFDKIAAGGMATIHIGRLRSSMGFGRTVAIKRLHPQFAKDPEFVAMFLDEARLASRIRHPNVVNTLDVVAEQGELFLVMEYVAGEVCSKIFDGLRDRGEFIPLDIMVYLMSGVLSGLHAAHEARDESGSPMTLVHRDVTPHNIILDIDGVPRVLDWGIAKAANRLQETRDGQIKGKPAYMAPEQLTGEAVDRRTDIYAACAVMWECVARRKMFGAGDNQVNIMRRVLEAKLEPPSKYAQVPPELEAVIMRGLRDPSRRHATATELAEDLERAVRPATQRQAAEWLRTVAGGTLGARQQLISRVESGAWGDAARSDADVLSAVISGELTGGDALAVSGSSPSLHRQTSSLGTTGTASVSRRLDVSEPTLEGVAKSESGAAQQRREGRSRAVGAKVAIGGAVILALGVAMGTALLRAPSNGSGMPVAVGAAAPTSPAPVTEMAPVAVARAPEPPPTSHPEETKPAEVAAPAVAAADTHKRAERSQPRRTTATAPSPPAPRPASPAAAPAPVVADAPEAARPACSPPHYIDARGLKRVKPECM